MNSLSIAVQAEWQRDYIARNCQEDNLNLQISILTSDFINASAQLLKGDFDVLIQELSATPIDLPENVAITALSERFEAHYVILSEKGFEENTLLGLAGDAVISSKDTNYLPALLEEFSSDYTYNSDEKGEIRLLSNYEITKNIQKTKIKILNSKEFPPLAGKGVLAFLCNKEDIATRKIVKKWHNKEVANLTNVERTFQKMVAPKTCGVFCEQDKMGNHHLWAAVINTGEPIERVRASSSTVFGLAEAAIAQLDK